MAIKIATATANLRGDQTLALLNSGYCRVYSGTRPATADTALSGNTLLAELTFGATAFGAMASATATANAVTSDASANATGTASFARLFKSDGTTVVFDASVGTSGADINLNTTSVVSGVSVSITSATWTEAQG